MSVVPPRKRRTSGRPVLIIRLIAVTKRNPELMAANDDGLGGNTKSNYCLEFRHTKCTQGGTNTRPRTRTPWPTLSNGQLAVHPACVRPSLRFSLVSNLPFFFLRGPGVLFICMIDVDIVLIFCVHYLFSPPTPSSSLSPRSSQKTLFTSCTFLTYKKELEMLFVSTSFCLLYRILWYLVA